MNSMNVVAKNTTRPEGSFSGWETIAEDSPGKVVNRQATKQHYNTSIGTFSEFLQRVLDDHGLTICWLGHIFRMHSAPSGLLKDRQGLTEGRAKVFLEELGKLDHSTVDRSASALSLWSCMKKNIDAVKDQPNDNGGVQVIRSLVEHKKGLDDLAEKTHYSKKTLQAVIKGTYPSAPYKTQMSINKYMAATDPLRPLPYPNAEAKLKAHEDRKKAEVESLKQRHEEEIAQLNKRHEEEIARLKKQHDENVQKAIAEGIKQYFAMNGGVVNETSN